MSRFSKKPLIQPPSPAISKRILVIGSGRHSGAKCVNWDSGNIPNVADFDAVIVSVASLDNHLNAVSESHSAAEWQRLRENVEKIRIGLLKLLDSNGDVFALLTPRKQFHLKPVEEKSPPMITGSIPSPSARDRSRSYGPFGRYMTNYDWCPLPFETVEEEGETLQIMDGAFSRYLEKVKRWNFIIELPDNQKALEWIGEYHGDKYAILLSNSIIAQNRYERVLAEKLRYGLHELVRGQSRWAIEPMLIPQQEPERISGFLTLLPVPTEISDHDALNIILEDFFGQIQKTAPPEWLEVVRVPGFDKLEEDKGFRLREIGRLNLQIQQIDQQIIQVDTYKQLLYETGTPLEEICRKTLEAMGAKIIPAEVAEEEFIIEFEGKRAIAEVKGNTKSISLTDLRQLGHYLEEHEITRGEKIKGILLGNAWRLVQIEQRNQTDFPANVIEYAQPRSIALVNTVELFGAYCAMREGKIEGRNIVRRLFDGVGVTLLVSD